MSTQHLRSTSEGRLGKHSAPTPNNSQIIGGNPMYNTPTSPPTPTDQPRSVSEVSQLIQGLLKSDPQLANVTLIGEVSGHSQPPSGHSYFSLRDSEASLRCVMFRYGRGHQYLEDGALVVCQGSANIYAPAATSKSSLHPPNQPALATNRHNSKNSNENSAPKVFSIRHANAESHHSPNASLSSPPNRAPSGKTSKSSSNVATP